MTIEEKLDIIKELLDIDDDTLTEDTRLDEINEWDSIAIVSTIAMFDSIFEKVVKADEVKKFKTIKDITDKME